jgi:hypothetical protein
MHMHEPRTFEVAFGTTRDEAAKLAEVARRKGLSLAGWLRLLAFAEAARVEQSIPTSVRP